MDVLSGGEKQRVAVSVGAIIQPKKAIVKSIIFLELKNVSITLNTEVLP